MEEFEREPVDPEALVWVEMAGSEIPEVTMEAPLSQTQEAEEAVAAGREPQKAAGPGRMGW